MTKRWESWLLATPALVAFAVFGLTPIFMASFGSVYEFGMFGRGWIGFEAFVDVFTSHRFWMVLWVTVKFALVIFPSEIILVVVISVVLSWAHQKIQAAARAALYVPSVAAGVMISFAWRFLVLPGGPLSRITGDILWLGSNPYAFWTISTMVVTTAVGSSVVVLMAGFVSVDSTLYEAARLDGCNDRQVARYITIPLVAPVIVYLGAMRFVGILQIWEYPWAMTGGGPNYSTTAIMLYIYQDASTGRVPQASVMSLVLMTIVAGTLLVYRLCGRKILF